MYIGLLHVKYRLLVSGFNETWIFWTDFRKIANAMKIHAVGAELFHADRRNTDSRTGMTQWTVAFRNFANTPKSRNTCFRNRTSPVFRPNNAGTVLLGLIHTCSKSLSPLVNETYKHNHPVNSLSGSETFLKSWQFINYLRNALRFWGSLPHPQEFAPSHTALASFC